MPETFCRLCAAFIEKHPEHLSLTNQGGPELDRLLAVREVGGLGEVQHTTLPGQALHERAVLETGGVLPPKRYGRR